MSQLRTYGHFLAALRRHLREPVSEQDSRERVARLLATRAERFVSILERGVFGNPASPYLPLFQRAGIGRADAARMVGDLGVEGALADFHAAGISVPVEELKRRRPEDFDNPVAGRHYELSSGGSRGARRRTHLDLDLVADDAAHLRLLQSAFGVAGRPWGIWQAVPPAGPGIKTGLILAKLGNPARRWFTPSRLSPARGTLRFFAFTHATVALSRLWRAPLPAPRHVPPGDAVEVARWLAEARAAGPPACLSTTPSLAVRAVLAARDAGLAIEGSFFRLHSEPFTPAKRAAIEAGGCSAATGYGMSEVGTAGLACATGAEPDDVHVLTDKVAVLQRDRPVGVNGATVGALLLTTLLPSSPKLLINVDVGDYGVLEERDCGCPFGELGLHLHLSGIRGYDKLTSEGNTFLGSDLLSLLEETLPARFGGAPTDYQLVEEEADGLTRVGVVVSPALGPLDEDEVVAAVLQPLLDNPDTRLMADMWREGGTLRVVRRAPHMTLGGKLLPLHIRRQPAASSQ